MTSFDSPVMLVTGGTGSIGREICAQALNKGWAVVLQGSSRDSVNESLEFIFVKNPSASAKGVIADITEAGAVEKLVEDAVDCFGKIDAVVDCIATGPKGARITGPFGDTDAEAYLAFAELSIVYLERLARASLPWLKKTAGCMIAFASDAGIFAAPRQTLIGAARAATVGFVRNLAMDVAREGVRVHCISPSFVDDTRTAKGLAETSSDRLEKARRRAGLGLPTPKDIAPLVLFLCGDGAKCITGQVISINGGLNA